MIACIRNQRRLFFIAILLTATISCRFISSVPPTPVEMVAQKHIDTETTSQLDVSISTDTPEPTLTLEPTVTLEPTNTPEPTNTQIPTSSPTPDNGTSRSNPFPRYEMVSLQNWEIQVLEVVRGDAAWIMIEDANMFNSPAPAGKEYLLVKIRVKSLHIDSKVQV